MSIPESKEFNPLHFFSPENDYQVKKYQCQLNHHRETHKMDTFLLTVKSVTHTPLLVFINHQYFCLKYERTRIRGKPIEARKAHANLNTQQEKVTVLK